MTGRIDTHQHLWRLSERGYSWITSDYEVLNRDYDFDEVIDDLDRAGIEATVLIQAADTYEDTFFMVSQARRFDRIKGVVGWLPLDRTEEAVAAMGAYSYLPVIKGVRNLTHDYSDPSWIRQSACVMTLSELASAGFTLDYVSTRPEHTEALYEVAIRLPNLSIVVDHMAKPPFGSNQWSAWADSLSKLAALPNVWCKLSGLSTASPLGWSAEVWQPAVDHCLAVFGSQRLMMGSDWPVMLLAGDFDETWSAQETTLAALTDSERGDVLFNTAKDFYRLDGSAGPRPQEMLSSPGN